MTYLVHEHILLLTRFSDRLMAVFLSWLWRAHPIYTCRTVQVALFRGTLSPPAVCCPRGQHLSRQAGTLQACNDGRSHPQSPVGSCTQEVVEV